MFRRLSSLPITRFHSFLLGASGTVYLISRQRIIHADNQITSKLEVREDSRWKPATVSPDTEQILRNHALSYKPDTAGTGIVRFDSAVIPSNFPSEDYLASSFCYLSTHAWSFFGVFDGHNGFATSSFLAQNLLNALIGSLADLFSKHAPILSEHVELGSTETGRPFPPPEEIDRIIKKTFLDVDNVLVHEAVDRAFANPSKARAIEALATAHAGSCALVAFYESDIRALHVALAGDSRAVLGRRVKGTETYEVHVLSHDQNAHNPAEVVRMNAAHPGETIFERGRVLGWGLSRAFGDAAYKWGLDIQKRLHEAYLGDRPPGNLKTPPYFTAEPEITTTEVKSGDFLVMASDGLWDCLTNEEVVGLVAVWLKRNILVEDDNSRHANIPGTQSTLERAELPVQLQEDKTQMYPYWRTAKKFINMDNNAAIHLVRNAIGGADRDLTAALLSMTAPRSRRYRDDIGVQVIFFD